MRLKIFKYANNDYQLILPQENSSEDLGNHITEEELLNKIKTLLSLIEPIKK